MVTDGHGTHTISAAARHASDSHQAEGKINPYDFSCRYLLDRRFPNLSLASAPSHASYDQDSIYAVPALIL